MSDVKLGVLPPPSARPKDAIHVAVAAVTAAEKLEPGARVNVTNGGAYKTIVAGGCGIVDPFLLQSVQPGQKFWVLLDPGTTTDLRHEWTHPAFPNYELESDRGYNDGGGCSC